MRKRVLTKVCRLVAPICLVLTLLMPARGVYAAFPGQNGKILYASIAVQGDLENPTITRSINTMNSDNTGKRTILESNSELSSPEWSADGQQLTWSDTDGHNVKDIFIANTDGSNKRRITNLSDDEDVNAYSGGALRPSFSPDGKKIIYEKSFNGFDNPICSIHIISIQDTNDTAYNQDEGECHGAPQISPDGTKIAYFRSNGNNLELYTMSLDGGNSNLLTSIPWSEDGRYALSNANLTISLDWSPDGSRIVYSRQDGTSFGESSILIISSTGGDPQVLKAASMVINGTIYTATSYGTPKFTPDGNISFVELQGELDGVNNIENSTVTGKSSIKVMDISGSDKQTVDSVEVLNAPFIGFYKLYYTFISVTLQPVHNKASLGSPDTNKPISLQTPDGSTITCSSANKESTQAKQDSSYQYPLGLVNFCFDTDSETNEVSLTFVTDLKPGEVKARKYNSTNQRYFDVPNATITDTTYEGQQALKLTYTIIDNGQLDLNPEIGKITDPVGLATTGSLASTGESQAPIYTLASILTIPAVVYIIRRKKTHKI